MTTAAIRLPLPSWPNATARLVDFVPLMKSRRRPGLRGLEQRGQECPRGGTGRAKLRCSAGKPWGRRARPACNRPHHSKSSNSVSAVGGVRGEVFFADLSGAPSGRESGHEQHEIVDLAKANFWL